MAFDFTISVAILQGISLSQKKLRKYVHLKEKKKRKIKLQQRYDRSHAIVTLLSFHLSGCVTSLLLGYQLMHLAIP